ncbi:MAG: zinc ABC transporter substrate-binding protein [Candidatus Riflebacteria bacterium]|nr:zinc ABC transporter substrate-binding protein [Candidatus Riflebacteria bacterium]
MLILFCLLFCKVFVPFLATASEEKPMVFVSILPQKYFVDRIVGDKIAVEVMVGSGQSPHTFEPMPRQLSLLAKASLYFGVGIPFEKAIVEKVKSGFKVKVVDTSEGIKFRKDECSDHDHESSQGDHKTDAPEGPNTQNNSGSTSENPGADNRDPHHWLDPQNAKLISQNIFRELVQFFPDFSDEFKKNYDLLLVDLDKLDSDLKNSLTQVKGNSFLVFHPAYGYFAEKYGLKQLPVESEGKEPSPRQLAELIRKAKFQKIKVVFVQPQFAPKAAETLANEIGATITNMDPLAYNYLENMREIAKKILDSEK